MAKKFGLVPKELISEYYQINRPEIRTEGNIHELLEDSKTPDDVRAKLLSQLIVKYQKLMQPDPPPKPFEIPKELLDTLKTEEEEIVKPEKSSNEYMLKFLSRAVPKTKRKYLLDILDKLEKSNFIFNDNGELIERGKTIYRTHIIDLFAYLMRDMRRAEPPPHGFNSFVKGIIQANIPQSWIGNKFVREQISFAETDPYSKEEVQETPKKRNKIQWSPWTG